MYGEHIYKPTQIYRAEILVLGGTRPDEQSAPNTRNNTEYLWYVVQ